MSELKPTVEDLFELKSAVLNIDWEISDETLTELTGEVTKLQDKWVGKKVLLVYLQILKALCQYIGVSREKAHPGTFLLLKEAFNGLEGVVLDPAMDQARQNQDVMAYAARYNQLKKEIAAGDFIPGPPSSAAEADHTEDTVFDSMVHAMVQSPKERDSEPEVVTPAPPRARPAVQVAFNKADGTEVDPDRNEADEFAEADELLDAFFDDDDDIPVPGAVRSLGVELEEDVLVEDYVAMDLAGSSSPGQKDEGELSLDSDAESDRGSEAAASFQKMEEALDDFFGDEDDDDLLEPVSAEAEDDLLIDDALDDFFGEDVDASVVAEAAGSESEKRGQGASALDEDRQAMPSVVDSEDIVVAEGETGLDEDSDRLVLTPEAAADEFVVEDTGREVFSVEELQRLLLSVDWEADDQLLRRLEEEIDSLAAIAKDNGPARIHLSLLRKVIGYIGREQAEVISESLTCLRLLVDSLENLMQDQTGDTSHYSDVAVKSFVDWHDLVVLDLEHRLAQCGTVAGLVAEPSVGPAEEDEDGAGQRLDASLSPDIAAWKEDILKEVKALIGQKIEELKTK